MIDALISGHLTTDPKPGTATNGNRFATARVLVSAGDKSLNVSAIAFEPAAVDALLVLSKGDAVSLAGELTPKTWTDRDGNAKPSADLRVHAVLTQYHVRRRRNAITPDPLEYRPMPGEI